MKILLVAYEFPPSPSPQSLRWKYFARELVRQGIEVHVLCPDMRPGQVATEVPDGVVTHRIHPGPVTGAVDWVANWHRKRKAGPIASGQPVAAPAVASQQPAALNWKGKLLVRMQATAGRLYFPDARGEWRWFAGRALRRLLDELQPDVVVSSHEPATTIEVGSLAKQAGFPWLVDLGDPVLSFYTPGRWRRRSLALERRACREADCVTVTTERAREALVERHAIDPDRITVLTQGFDAADDEPFPQGTGVSWCDDRLELLYTGSFYHFRHPRALADAVESMRGVRLTIASSRVPDWLRDLSESIPEKIRLLGFVPHSDAKRLQKQAHVLVNLANADAMHVPGKLYEYLGAGKPILHVGNNHGDAGADLVRRCGGVVCGNEVQEIVNAMGYMRRRYSGEEQLAAPVASLVASYSWQSLGAELASLLRATAR